MKNISALALVCFLGIWGCNHESQIALAEFEIDYYERLAKQIVARELCNINVDDDYKYTAWMDKSRKVHVVYTRDSDREEFVGVGSYCHYDFAREIVEVVLETSGEMLKVSVERQNISAECINRQIN